MKNSDFNFIDFNVKPEAKLIIKSAGLNFIKEKFYTFQKEPFLDKEDATSLLGTPVFDTLTFYGNGTDGQITYYDIANQKTITISKLRLDIALVTVTKNIMVVKTPIAGRNGTVKQYINLGDYDVQINGVFSSQIPDTRPDLLIRQLHDITNSTAEVNVASNFLNLFGIQSLVFERCEFPMNQDGRDVQHFTLDTISETPFSIKVQTNETSTTNVNSQGDTFNTVIVP